MSPVPDHGEQTYRGSGRLPGKRPSSREATVVSVAVAIASAREGADVLIANLDEDEDANETERWIEKAGRKGVLVRGDIQNPEYSRQIIGTLRAELGGIDILVNNAAYQASFNGIGDICDGEWELTFKVNIHAMFYLSEAAVPHMSPGSNTSSGNADSPSLTFWPVLATLGNISSASDFSPKRIELDAQG
jgi:NAD(P)-dependent dehydrogenase (short-subunit alcohol dehydrogenase family)